MKLSRLESAQRAELRTLVPCERRRQHLVLVLEEERRGEGGAPLRHHRVIAVVREGDREALRPLVQRSSQGSAALRLAEAEDGFLDAGALWGRGERVDDLAKGSP